MNEYSFSAIEFAKIQGVVINKAEIVWMENCSFTYEGEQITGTRIVFRNKDVYIIKHITLEEALKELKIKPV